MGFVSDEDVLSRINSPDNLVNRLEIHKINRGRGDAIEVPIEIKKVIAIVSNDGEKQTDLARAFDISQPQISHYENGKINGIPSEEIKEVIGKVKSRKKEAEDAAIEAVMSSLSLLTPERLERVSKAKDIASIAKDMAVVADKMSDKTVEGNKNVHLHLYSPNVKDVKDYEIIDVA